jgi:glucose/arabinose dehydrogenase/mono/diheme cytochrome c family protein
MKRKFQVAFLVAFSMLIFSCHENKDNSEPLFNPKPTAEYLSPEESMKSIYLPKGYHIELVASEPMIKEPVAIAWDGNGRMYVAEMNTYMQNADATGEQQPTSRILRLEDTDNDGKMDKVTVFADHLLLPRMMQCVGDELLVNETNSITIYSYKDTTGDGIADVKKVVYQNEKYVSSDANMEHQRSGLDWNIDNWMYITYDPVRFRYTNGVMKVDTLVGGTDGQWGVTHDNYGRLYFTSAGGENPARGIQINPVYGRLDFPDQISDEFQKVWPIIATPDVQGGMGRLRPDNTLNHFTACCGQSIFRGDHLPNDLVGDYIICEPVGRIVRRAKVIDEKGKIVLENAYHQKEFISSSDMNFRPVNSATGPDGNLYIVDMYRGIIQQGNWTKKGSFLRKKIDSLGLDKNIGRGRIYRVVHDGYKQGAKPNMLNEPTGKLLTYLNHPNGWWRDNAQKQIIVLGDKSVVPSLKAMVAGQSVAGIQTITPLGKIHALWTLEGLDAIDKDILSGALKDENSQVRKAAVWISEPYLKRNDDQIITEVAALKNDSNYNVRVQVLLSMYNVTSEKAKSVVKELIDQNVNNEMLIATRKALDENEMERTLIGRLGDMSVREKGAILRGASTFRSLCANCHGVEGKGIATGTGIATAPSLVGSKRLNYAQKDMAIQILLHGLSGPIDEKTYSSEMPAMGGNSDWWIASVLSYARFEFGKNASEKDALSPIVTREEVKKIRDENAGRNKAWTLKELANKK